jgi:ATP-dependent DNA ligase
MVNSDIAGAIQNALSAGLRGFPTLRPGRSAQEVTMMAFDLIALQGEDLRNEPLFNRKQRSWRGYCHANPT